MEKGDVFIISKPYKGRNRKSKNGGYYYYECKFPKKEFIIDRLTKSGLSIYYFDNRTNNSCLCNHCKNNVIKEKCIPIIEVEIIMTNKQKARDLKLKSILKNEIIKN
jgi:hypothetical protein